MLVQLRSAIRFVDAARRTKQAAYDKGFVLAAFPGGPAKIGDQGDSTGSRTPDEGVVPVKYIKMLNRVFPGLMPAARRSRRWLERNVSDAYRATINGLGALISSEEGKKEEEKKKPNPGPQSSGGNAASLPPDGPEGGEKDRTNRSKISFQQFRKASSLLRGNRNDTIATEYLSEKPKIPKDKIQSLPDYSTIPESSLMSESEFNAHYPSAGEIDPNRIGTVQETMSRRTGIKLKVGDKKIFQRMTVADIVTGLRLGIIKPKNLELIDLYVFGGRMVTADNRRLVAARLAGVKVRYRILRYPYAGNTFDKVDTLVPSIQIKLR